jgi:hypothetical protein
MNTLEATDIRSRRVRRWVMTKLSKCGAEAWPISHEGPRGRPVLEKVVVACEHADGNGSVHLTADQALYVHSRLSQIAGAFLPHHYWSGRHPHDQATTHPDGPAVHELAMCGAEAWPIASEGMEKPPDLEKVVVESNHPGGRGPIHLSPGQTLYIQDRLTHITLAFLHDKGWGGEDARSQ